MRNNEPRPRTKVRTARTTRTNKAQEISEGRQNQRIGKSCQDEFLIAPSLHLSTPRAKLGRP